MKKWTYLAVTGMLLGTAPVFTGCIDNDEPEGITILRQAKSELLRARASVEEANAASILADAALKEAQKAVVAAQARYYEALAAEQEAKALKAQYEAAGKTGLDWDGNTFIDGSNHRIQIFYMERGEGASNLKISFNLKTIPDGQLAVSKNVEHYYAPQLADTTYTMVSGASSFLRAFCSTFVLNDEIFLLGGARGFVGTSTLQSAVSKSSDGETFATVADSTAVGPICGATVVTNNAGNTAYLFGGLYYDEAGARVMNNTIYKSTDGVTWTAVEGINEAYTGTFNPCVVVDENDIAWVFGGFNSFSGSYTPYSTTVDDMDPSFAAWAFALN